MSARIERWRVRWDLFRCCWHGTHLPVVVFARGELFLRCASCRLRTTGIQVG